MTLEQARRFYDGGLPATVDADGRPVAEVPADPDAPMQILLERLAQGRGDVERFRLDRRIAYRDSRRGQIVVPADLSFETDLTSVPSPFLWLVPRTGTHLPAALLHDGMIPERPSPGCLSPRPSVVTHDRAPIDRVEADRIFRDAMRDSGVRPIRRWLVWTAVTLATIWYRDATAARSSVRWYYQLVMVSTLLLVAATGVVATAELVGPPGWWGTADLPWIVGDGFWRRFVTGLAGAVVIPALLGIAWWRFWRAGVIAGVALGALFHVTLGVALLSVVSALGEILLTEGPLGWFRRADAIRRRSLVGFVVVVVLAVAGVTAIVAIAVAAVRD